MMVDLPTPVAVSERSSLRSNIVLLIGLLLVCAVIYGVYAVILLQREELHAKMCQNNLKQFGLALHNYLSVNGTFPPAYTVDANGRKMHSWRALLLPYFEIGSVASVLNEYDFDQPWDSPHNMRLADRMPLVYQCRSDRAATSSNANYFAVIGQETFWPAPQGRRAQEIADGLSHTIAIVEVEGAKVPWLEPRDLTFNELTLQLNDSGGHDPSSRHRGVVNVLMADGSAHALPQKISPTKLRGLLTVAGGEEVDPKAP